MKRYPKPLEQGRRPYPHPDLPDVYILPLTRGRTALISADDVQKVGDHRWAWGASRYGDGQAYRRVNGKTTLLARVIADAQEGENVGFWNDCTLDCRRSNLSFRTDSQIVMRSQKQKGRSSIYKGVSRFHGKWKAYIWVDGKLQYLGLHTNELHAAQVYDDAAREHFGPFARPNFGGE